MGNLQIRTIIISDADKAANKIAYDFVKSYDNLKEVDTKGFIFCKNTVDSYTGAVAEVANGESEIVIRVYLFHTNHDLCWLQPLGEKDVVNHFYNLHIAKYGNPCGVFAPTNETIH